MGRMKGDPLDSIDNMPLGPAQDKVNARPLGNALPMPRKRPAKDFPAPEPPKIQVEAEPLEPPAPEESIKSPTRTRERDKAAFDALKRKRPKVPPPWIQVRGELFSDLKLDPYAYRIYCKLFGLAFSKGINWCSITKAQIIEETGISRKKVFASLKILENRTLIAQWTNSGSAETEFIIYEPWNPGEATHSPTEVGNFLALFEQYLTDTVSEGDGSERYWEDLSRIQGILEQYLTDTVSEGDGSERHGSSIRETREQYPRDTGAVSRGYGPMISLDLDKEDRERGTSARALRPVCVEYHLPFSLGGIHNRTLESWERTYGRAELLGALTNAASKKDLKSPSGFVKKLLEEHSGYDEQELVLKMLQKIDEHGRKLEQGFGPEGLEEMPRLYHHLQYCLGLSEPFQELDRAYPSICPRLSEYGYGWLLFFPEWPKRYSY